jgi:hypothetical protein
LAIVSEGGAGYMFDEAAEKVCIVRSSILQTAGGCRQLAAPASQLATGSATSPNTSSGDKNRFIVSGSR